MNTYPPGTLRYVRDDGEEVITSPHEALYSTATMAATHYWDGARWVEIFDELDEDN